MKQLGILVELTNPTMTERTKFIVCIATGLVQNHDGRHIEDREIGYSMFVAAHCGAVPVDAVISSKAYNLMFNDIRTVCEAIQLGVMLPGDCTTSG